MAEDPAQRNSPRRVSPAPSRVMPLGDAARHPPDLRQIAQADLQPGVYPASFPPTLEACMTAAVLFHRFGPYHLARLAAAGRRGVVTGIEVSAVTREYAWD